MNDLNHIVLIGRLTRDAETPAGDRGPVKISLAVNRSKKQGDQFVDEANFFDAEYWHRSILPHLVKGKQIAISGELRQDRWEQDGQARSKVLVVAKDIQLLGGGQGSTQNDHGTGRYQDRAAGPAGDPSASANAASDDGFGDDIPF